jgi:hypothetical protein
MRLRNELFVWLVYAMIYSVAFALLFTLLPMTATWLGIRSLTYSDLIGLGKTGLIFGFAIGLGICWITESERKKHGIQEPDRPRRW